MALEMVLLFPVTVVPTAPSRYRVVGTLIERTLVTLVRVGAISLVLSVLALIGYLFVAFGMGVTDGTSVLTWLWRSPTVHLLVELGAFALCVTNGPLVLYVTFVGIDDVRSGLAVVFGCMGFGFGVALLELSGPVVADLLWGS